MATESKNSTRPVIDEFVVDIAKHKIPTEDTDIIFFRDDMKEKKRRKVYKIPLEFLRFRKDNGRIASDVLTYEYIYGKLNETTDFGQSVLKNFLKMKDTEKTIELTNSILQHAQNSIAVITTDGFLINGNRRKLVFENLLEKLPGDERFKYLKVVILPGPNDEEPMPTLTEIEQIENRYQMQTFGKAEYYNFDKALSIKRKIELGMTLDEQLRDDPNFASLTAKEFEKKKKEFTDEYLEPLECIDRYLMYLKRQGHYNTVSEGKADKEGRWQAFRDYYNNVYRRLKDPKQRIRLNVTENEVGIVENIAFKIIRQRDIKGVEKKAHQIMRELPRLLSNPYSKKELFKLQSLSFELPKEETLDEKGGSVSEKTKDIIWSNKNASEIIWHVKNAYQYFENKQEQDEPFELLKSSLDKLNHSDMDVSIISIDRLDEAMRISREIQTKANIIEHDIYNYKKELESLGKKLNKSKK